MDEPEESGEPAATELGGEMTRFEALKMLSEEQLAKYLAALDEGRDPDGMALMMKLIKDCGTVEEVILESHDWFCCDFKLKDCPEDEDGDSIGCEACISRWLNEKKRWGFHTLMKEAQE